MYIIVLSNEGDLLDRTGQWSFRATFDRNQATKFMSRKDAEKFVRDLSVRMMWGDVNVQRVA